MNEKILYEIRVKGELNPSWKEWFCSEALFNESAGNTCILVMIEDQSALFGVLKKIRDLGLPLISVNAKSEDEKM